ncbi:LAQU0S04e03488g1_1 [Lachancea quebecensis]|uniref:LAQU0S04e03488g1_1 n=1 Tax=Lachancea quebecensis TaxID=1654605 RepID=A0A0P1KPF6_9SACH|nr:LAQU0S04e03488g1_1 [Lachancea quebecensis]
MGRYRLKPTNFATGRGTHVRAGQTHVPRDPEPVSLSTLSHVTARFVSLYTPRHVPLSHVYLCTCDHVTIRTRLTPHASLPTPHSRCPPRPLTSPCARLPSHPRGLSRSPRLSGSPFWPYFRCASASGPTSFSVAVPVPALPRSNIMWRRPTPAYLRRFHSCGYHHSTRLSLRTAAAANGWNCPTDNKRWKQEADSAASGHAGILTHAYRVSAINSVARPRAPCTTRLCALDVLEPLLFPPEASVAIRAEELMHVCWPLRMCLRPDVRRR